MKACEYCGEIDYHEIMECITCALDAKDPYTAGHSQREGKLDDEEWEAMKKHPSIGAEILSKSRHLKELQYIVLCHHERFDGKGYPLGLKGEEIPVGARIIAICDSIDAMTSNRSYRKAHDFDYCYQEIKNNLGKMYDPIIGQYVLDHWEEIISVIKISR